MAKINPMKPIPEVIYAKYPDQEISITIANKIIALPNPIFFTKQTP